MEFKSTKIKVSGMRLDAASKYAIEIPFGQWFLPKGPSSHILTPTSIWVRLTDNKYHNVSEGFYLELGDEREKKIYWRDYHPIDGVEIWLSQEKENG